MRAARSWTLSGSPFVGGETGLPVYILAWTTTPWTLPANTALCGGPKIDYVAVRAENPYTHEPAVYILAEERLGAYGWEKSDQSDSSDKYPIDVVIFDDIADTAGTLCKAAEVMREGGAKSVRAVVTHGVLSGNACQRIEASPLEQLICTDSLPIDPALCSKLHIETLAGSIAQTIRAIQNHTSVSETNVR